MRKIFSYIFKKILYGAIDNLSNEDKSKFYTIIKKAYLDIRYKKYREQYEIATNFIFNGDEILMYGNGKIIIGDGSYIGNYSTLQVGEGLIIKIGNNCSISHNVRMYTVSNNVDQDFNTKENKKKKSGNIEIEDGVWIGANVFINPGVTIGRNAVIGANSVVTKNIEPDSIYGGVPAKLIRKKNL